MKEGKWFYKEVKKIRQLLDEAESRVTDLENDVEYRTASVLSRVSGKIIDALDHLDDVS